MRKAAEGRLNSDEQVAEYVRKAHAIATSPDIDDALRETAFAKAIDLLSQKQVLFEQVAPTGVLLNQIPHG